MAHADQAINIDGDNINEDDKEKSLMLVVADVACSANFTVKLENFLDKYSDVNCISKSGKTLVHYIARWEANVSTISTVFDFMCSNSNIGKISINFILWPIPSKYMRGNSLSDWLHQAIFGYLIKVIIRKMSEQG